MSVPTNNLYNFVTQALENKYLVKYFYPWGEKGFGNIVTNLDDKQPNAFVDCLQDKPTVICHDQEPLDFDMYSDEQLEKQVHTMDPQIFKEWNKGSWKDLNLRWDIGNNCTNFWILLHSELDSVEIKKYEDTGLFKCAYWWAHAPIAIDWYRFARYDNRLRRESQDIKSNFLVYSRGTTGKRAYRKIFLESSRHIESVQVGSFKQYEISGDNSATYDAYDFAHTNCSVVLETVYDRIHLTEKTLRPLACGHPFLLLNGAGALEKIREYGFKTFQPYINESYDKEPNPNKRMQMVLNEMRRINSSSEKYQRWIWNGCQEIADFNKSLFFDDKFLWRVKTELRRNVRAPGMPKLSHKLIRTLSVMKSRERRHTMNQVKRRKRVELYLRLKRGIV
tara:strand:- start:400 stop:1575 length:1176 start_codon:yes stop_codon:yes gene_type:complete